MKLIVSIQLSLIAFLFSPVAFALVDMQGANYTETFVDMEIPDSGYNLRVERAYNSRTLYNGIFGFGMCSNFETKLEVLADGRLKRIECGSGQEIDFIPRTFSENDVQIGIKKIVAAMKKENPKMTASQSKAMEKKLAEDTLYRDEQNIKFGIEKTIKEDTVFYSVSNSADKIVYKKTHYQRDLEDGTSERFDLQGRITFMYDKNKNFIKFEYEGNKLTSVTSASGNKLSLSYYQTGKVKEIRGPRNLSALYKYDKINDLSYVMTASKEEYEYKYDALHNVVEISYPDKTKKKLGYNQDKDWVTSLTDRNGCVETYNYELSKTDPKNNFFSSVEKKCDGKVVNKSRYGFWFKDRKNKSSSFLTKLTIDINGAKSEIEYHDVFEKPLRIKRQNELTVYDYLANGLLKSKKVGNTLITYAYNKQNKVTEVREGKKFTKFTYDPRGNLTYAENSDGQKVQLNYDTRGRIVKLIDQAKRLINIEYDDKVGKPKMVERPGVGTIFVSYDSSGAVQKVRSKDNDPTVAVQVASAFNNLIEIVTPAGVQAGI